MDGINTELSKIVEWVSERIGGCKESFSAESLLFDN
jgi:hypothetical protein